MSGKIGFPWAAVFDKGLHEGTFGLDGVHEVVPGPFVEHFIEGDWAKFAVDGFTVEVGGEGRREGLL